MPPSPRSPLSAVALLPLVLLLGLPAPAAPPPETVAIDRAQEALAEGDPRRASRVLEAALPAVEAAGDADASSRVRCLLGTAQLRSGSPAAAERTLEVVPLEAACGRRAGSLRAEAMAANERLAEAAALLEELGAVPLGDDRDGQSAEAVAALARRILADPDRGRSVGLPILTAALELRVSDERAAALAREIAAYADGGRSRSSRACDALVGALAVREDRSDRLAAAAVCPPSEASTLLTALQDDDPDALWLRAALAPDAAARDLLRERALRTTADRDTLGTSLGGPTLSERRLALALELADRGDLAALPLLDADGSADALRARAALLVEAGRAEEALADLSAHLDRFPADPHRSEVTELRAATLLDLARAATDPAEALARYDELLSRHADSDVAPTAAFEAGVAARSAGDADGARRRWDELVARWPYSEGAAHAIAALARQRAFDDGNLEAARDLLRRRADQAGAREELERLGDASLWISSGGPTPGVSSGGPTPGISSGGPTPGISPHGIESTSRSAHVRIGTRNLERLELRIHEIDLEAFARAGGRLDGLAELDVTAIAPDRTLPVQVPPHAEGADVAFDVPVPLGPGLYAVTAASAEEEARAMLLVSDLTVVARAVGTDLAVATFDRGGGPAGHARVLITGPSGTVEGETDATGLWTGHLDSDGDVVVLAERRGSWAAAELGVSGTHHAPTQFVDAELERRAVLPGDTVGVRAVARDATGEPLVGGWTVWIEGGEPLDADTDGHGILHVALDVPEIGLDAFEDAVPVQDQLRVLGVPPGNAEPLLLGTVQRPPRDPGGRTLEARLEGVDAVFRVSGQHGEPVAGVFVASGEIVAQTDPRGEVRVAGPPLGLPWRASAHIVGTRVERAVERVPPEPRRVALSTDQPHARPGEVPKVTLRLTGLGGAPRRGAVELTVERRIDPPSPIEARPDPWVPEPRTGIGGWSRWRGAAPDGEDEHPSEPHWRTTLDVDGVLTAELPALPAGRWRVTAIPWDGASASSAVDLVVSPAGLRVLGARDTGIGDRLVIVPEGAAALLTAESDRLLWAAVRKDGRRAEATVDERWRGAVTIAATAPDGQVAVQTVDADASLDVAVVVDPDGDGKQLRAVVTDRVGRPVSADVSLTAWDVRLEDVVGRPTRLGDGWARGTGSPAGAIGAALWSGARGEAIAPALLAEAALAREREKAREATRSGLLSDNALAEALLGDGLALSGSGAGGGGSAYGTGGLGSAGHGAGGGIMGKAAARRGVPGVRERVLWQVSRTDSGGAVSARLAGPAARYRVRVTAVAGSTVGVAEVEVDLAERLWWVVHEPAAGLPGDEATPRVTVVNGLDERAAVAVRLDQAEVKATLEPGTARSLTLGDPIRAGGGPRTVGLWRGESVALQALWRFPLQEGPPDPAGALTVWAVGAGGAPPLAEIALRDDPAAVGAPWRAAVAGRVALAVLPWAEPVEGPRLRRAVSRARTILRQEPAMTPAQAAQALLFLAEARRAGFSVSAAALEQQAARIGPPQFAAERALVLSARLDAGLPVDRNLIALVERDGADGDAPPEVRAALIALGRPVPGEVRSALGLAARRTSGATLAPAAVRALRDAGPPLPGDPALPAWITAVADREPRVGGRDRARGAGGGPGEIRGEIRVAEGDSEVPAGAWRWRARPPGGEPSADAPAARASRIPLDGDGRPIVRRTEGEGTCGPCRVSVGDWLEIEGVDPERGPSGLAVRWRSPGAVMLQAQVPGRFTVVGTTAGGRAAGPLVVEVVPNEPITDVAPQVALAVARDAVAARRRLPLPDLGPKWAAPIADLALRDALQGDDDAGIAAAFRTLAATDPTADVSLTDVARAARAMRATGDHEGAIRAWRAGLDAAFAAEAAGIGRVEGDVGLLVAVQRVREAALRYPDGPATGEALYLLPARLLDLADRGLPADVQAAGITATDVRLTAAAWDREFLASYPDHPRAVSAGLRLARILVTIGAPEPAAAWSARVGAANPDAPLRDALLYIEALARSESGDTAEAERLLKRLVFAPFAGPDGVPAPSVHRGNAQIVLGRLFESRGQVERALEAYASAGSSPEAERARLALQTPALEAPTVVRLQPGAPARLDLEVTNVDTVRIRAYAVDLRTLFLRDGGLSASRDVAVAGVSPAWSGERRLGVGAFPATREIGLPLDGAGAWLVQLEGAGLVRSVLVVRSTLALAATDTDEGRRVAVRRADAPASGVEVRALANGQVVPAVTDVRGVAEVPTGAAVIAWAGPHWAFTDPDAAPQAVEATEVYSNRADDRGLGRLLELLEQGAQVRQSEDAHRYQQRFGTATEKLQLDAL
jgi:tetratricopeptide (TPR) repeat protein